MSIIRPNETLDGSGLDYLQFSFYMFRAMYGVQHICPVGQHADWESNHCNWENPFGFGTFLSHRVVPTGATAKKKDVVEWIGNTIQRVVHKTHSADDNLGFGATSQGSGSSFTRPPVRPVAGAHAQTLRSDGQAADLEHYPLALKAW